MAARPSGQLDRQVIKSSFITIYLEYAKRMADLAKEHDIPIREDQKLADMLYGLNMGDFISPESFKLVAEVVCFLYHTDQEWRDQHSFLDDLMVFADESE